MIAQICKIFYVLPAYLSILAFFFPYNASADDSSNRSNISTRNISSVYDKLANVYNASGLEAYIQAIRQDPISYSDEEIAEFLYQTMYTLDISGLRLKIALELTRAGIELQSLPLTQQLLGVSFVINTVHDDRVMQVWNEGLCSLVDCHENKWYLGENLKDRQLPFMCNRIETPNLGYIINGSDVGLSVRMIAGYTVMYMGDSGSGWGNPGLTDCGVPGECNDPITILIDTDGPENGLDMALLVDENNPSRFRPLRIPGVNQAGYEIQPPVFDPYAQVVGAMEGSRWLGDDIITYELYLWFATGLVTDKPRCYLACSYDGVEFTNCPWEENNGMAKEFSREKFIFVSPVFFHWWDQIETGGSSTLSKLKSHITYLPPPSGGYGPGPGYGFGMLLFATAGGPQDNSQHNGGYRESPLYLAYMELQTGLVWYYTGNDWSRQESQAMPILSEQGHPDEEKKLYWFGEISVKSIPEWGDIEDIYLVMLCNHPDRRIYYRTASLLEPDVWSAPQLTCAVGYGGYIIDDYTRVEPGNPDRLILYHAVDAWTGKTGPCREPYGVFTTQLRLREAPGNDNCPCGEAPVWPPQMKAHYSSKAAPNPVVSSTGNMPKFFILHQNYPNPFNQGTIIRYDLPDNVFVSLKIYDSLGQEVTTLVNGNQTPGYKSIIWDGKNNTGKSVSSGIYLYKIQADDKIQSNKMLLFK